MDGSLSSVLNPQCLRPIFHIHIMVCLLCSILVSTKDARQSTKGATCDGRLIGEVSEIKSEIVTKHKIYTGSGRQLDVIPNLVSHRIVLAIVYDCVCFEGVPYPPYIARG
jgi:hypothetical protein